MPERALLRLQRARIPVFEIKKEKKDELSFWVLEKDAEKIQKLYANKASAYTLKDYKERGLQKWIKKLKNRLGFVLGALLFCAASLYIEPFVFGVEIVGSKVYEREVYTILHENGLKPFKKYNREKEDIVCARLLSLESVEFCSVKKSGGKIIVEIRTNIFQNPIVQKGDLLASHSGELLSLAVLSGTPLKKVGDSVQAGEPLVGAYMQTPSGEYKGVKTIARASIACVYEQEIHETQAQDEKQAFAIAYLSLALKEKDEITETEIVKNGESFHVKIKYTIIEKINL